MGMIVHDLIKSLFTQTDGNCVKHKDCLNLNSSPLDT